MERLVWGVFKAIILSMIFMVVWQLGFYLYNVATLDQRMSNIMVSLEKTVSENNYLPHEEAEMYSNIINAMQNSFMQNTSTNGYTGFIAGWNWNCSDGGNYQAFAPNAAICPTNTTGGGTGAYDMSIPMNYGSVACIHIGFQINAPWVGFGSATETVRTGGNASEWHVESLQTNIAYTSYVPCLKYRKIT